jgi:hypothetical protein
MMACGGTGYGFYDAARCNGYSDTMHHFEGSWRRSCIHLLHGEQMISRSRDQTVRRWDLQVCEETKKAKEVYGETIIAVSKDGRCVVTVDLGGGPKAREAETGVVRDFAKGYTWVVGHIDISVDIEQTAGSLEP